MSYKIEFLEEAYKDYSKLDNSLKIVVNKALLKLSENPLANNQGGYGKPLSNINNIDLSGLCK